MRTNDGHKTIVLKRGGFGDPGGSNNAECEIWLNAFEDAKYHKPCKHCGPVEDVDLGHGKEKGFRVPRLIVCFTQSGYDATGVCADCVIEALS